MPSRPLPRRTLVCASLLAVILPMPAGATPATDSGPLTAQARLTAITAEAARGARAGAVLSVQGCGIAFEQAAGLANRRTGRALLTGDPLRIGSVGKMYTAMVFHRLAARGAIDLDRPADTWLLPGDATGVAGRGATLRQLLNHTAGVPDYYDLPSIRRWDATQPFLPPRILAAIANVPATGAPGAGYRYSNAGYHLAVLALERATGTPFASLMAAEAIAPLGVRATTYHEAAPGGDVHGYAGTRDWWSSAENSGPDSGITAPVAEVAALLRALFIEDGPLRATGDAMQAGAVETGRPRLRAGAGAERRTTRGGLELVGHTGNVEGYLTFAYAARTRGLTLVGHINAASPDTFATFLRDAAAVAETACAAQGGAGG